MMMMIKEGKLAGLALAWAAGRAMQSIVDMYDDQYVYHPSSHCCTCVQVEVRLMTGEVIFIPQILYSYVSEYHFFNGQI